MALPTASDNVFPKIIESMNTSDQSAPADSSWKIYAKAPGIYARSSNAIVGPFLGNPMTTAGDTIYGGTGGAATRLPGGTSGYVLTSNGATSAPSWQASAGGGAATSVDAVPASPNAADEEFTALSGWTTLGSLTASEVTFYPGHYHISKTATGTFAVHGIYKAIPSMPFTMTTKLKYELIANFQSFGLMLLEASPGKLELFGPTFETSRTFISHSGWTNRTTRASYVDAGPDRPAYWRMIVASSTDVTYQVSDDGIFYETIWTSLSPGFTIGNFGIYVTGQDNSVTFDAAVKYIRFT